MPLLNVNIAVKQFRKSRRFAVNNFIETGFFKIKLNYDATKLSKYISIYIYFKY